MKRGFLVLIVFFSYFLSFGAPTITAKVLEIVDGTTIVVHIEDAPVAIGLSPGTRECVRYIGVRIPENEADAEIARTLNSILVEGKEVFLELDEKIRDENGCLLAYVFLDRSGKLMVNAILVSTDLVAFATTSRATKYDTLLSYLDHVPVTEPKLICPVVYSWDETGRHLGETACVRGPVASVGTSRGGDVFLNLGKPYPEQGRFTLFIPARYVGKFEALFGARFWNNLVGRVVQAVGEIRLYQGSPEIQLSDPLNLAIL
jgi:hypothetical protein